MLKKFLLVLSVGAMTLFTGFQLVPVTVAAQTPEDAVCAGLEMTGGQCGPGAETEINQTLQTAINLFSIVVGFAAVLMIIIGGFKYITSSGDTAGVNSAKNTILFAVVGLVIVALAQVIVRFVIDQV